MQAMIRNNLVSQKYLTESYSTCWQLANNSETITRSPSRKSNGPDFSAAQLGLLQNYKIPREEVLECDIIKTYELNRNLIAGQSGKSKLGSLVTLAQLLHSSEVIVQLLVNDDLLDRFRSLSKKIPQFFFFSLVVYMLTLHCIYTFKK
jgi:hypothetical protein